jgi:hypothetical protein
MKKSHTAMLSAVGAVVLLTIGAAASLRFSQSANGAELPELSGERTTRTHEATGFTGIDVRGEWQVEVVHGDSWQVELSYPVELENYLDLRVAAGRFILNYDVERGVWRRRDRNPLNVTAHITMPALEEAELSGAAVLTFSGFEGKELEIESSGAAKIEGTDSRYADLELDMSGAGSADLRGVATTNARVDISGAPDVTLLMAGGDLSGDMSGAGTLEYYGTTRSQSIDTSGVAKVRQRN